MAREGLNSTVVVIWNFLAFSALYYLSMLKPTTQRRRLRAVALVVALVQLALVTWVPVVHPLIHPDRSLTTPVAEFDNTTSGETQLVLGEVMCVACMVSPNALPSPYRFFTPSASARRQQTPKQTARLTPLQSFIPTHPARAPPSV